MSPPLFREPYRLLFPLAMLLGLGLIVAWGAQLAGGPTVMNVVAHGAAMLWFVYGTAVLGFLLTAYPKQNGAPQPGPAVVVALAVVQLAAAVLWLAGDGPRLVAGGLAVLAWGLIAAWSMRVAWPSLRKKWDATTAVVPPILVVAVVAIGLSASGDQPVLAPALGVHAVLVPLALSLLDRILPFFSRVRVDGYDGFRRPWFTGSLLVLGLLRALSEGRTPGAMVMFDLALAALVLRQWHGWRPLQGLRPPLLGVLHLGIAWIVVGYLADAGATWLQLPGAAAARHLWTIGGLGTLVLSIAIRVTRGHGGHPTVLAADGAAIIGLVQLAVVLRGVLPLVGLTHAHLWATAAIALALAFLLWLLRLGPLVLRGPAK